VERVRVIRGGLRSLATLHLTTHHLILAQSHDELWLAYPLIHSVELQPTSNISSQALLTIKCRNFVFITLFFEQERELREVFRSIQRLTCVGK
ncbi:phosphatidylinositol-3-phosphatase ymr1, partial [Dispira simplex]